MSTTLERKITTTAKIELHGKDIADLFWELDAVAQAEFFNRLGEKEKLVFQLQAVTNSYYLEPHGRCAMTRIGEYANPNT